MPQVEKNINVSFIAMQHEPRVSWCRGIWSEKVEPSSGEAACALRACFCPLFPGLFYRQAQIALFARVHTVAHIMEKERESPTIGKVIDSSNASWVTVQQSKNPKPGQIFCTMLRLAGIPLGQIQPRIFVACHPLQANLRLQKSEWPKFCTKLPKFTNKTMWACEYSSKSLSFDAILQLAETICSLHVVKNTYRTDIYKHVL